MPEITGLDTGGAPILSYNLQYDLGTGNGQFTSIIGEAPPNLDRIISQAGLVTDVLYQFRYRVQNKYGWSDDFSPILTKRTATIPDKTQTPELSITNLLYVRVSWDVPYNGGSAVTSFTILFEDHD